MTLLPNYKTADLCDEFSDKLNIIEPGFISYGGNIFFQGPISTVKCFEDNSKVRHQLSTPGNGRVLVVDAGGSRRCAMLGDILADMGVKNGWNGIIMNGLIRDSFEISQMPIGVMALGMHPEKSEKKNIGDIDTEISFSGVTFKPGDWVYADHDGIVLSKEQLKF